MASGELEMAGVPLRRPPSRTLPAHEEKPPEELLEAGQHLTGRIQSIHGDSVFFELGYRSPGVIPLRQFVSGKKPEVGQRIEVLVERIAARRRTDLSQSSQRSSPDRRQLGIAGQGADRRLPRQSHEQRRPGSNGERLAGFSPVEPGRIGIHFRFDSVRRAKAPRRGDGSQSAEDETSSSAGARSLQIERKEAEEKFWQTVEVDQTYTGKRQDDQGLRRVRRSRRDVDGFLHIGEMSWHRLKHPSETVARRGRPST